MWWKEGLAAEGFRPTLRRLLRLLWEFVLESTPAQRRQRYGDVEYDWAYRVNTTSATVGWRDRLLGQFHSAYQPTEPAPFHEMVRSLKIDFREFTFIDLGSGKGRVLLMASDYPFRQVLGVELLHELHRVAQENIAKYKSDAQQCFVLQSLCGDAREFDFPLEPTVLYLFNPLPAAGLSKVLSNLERSLREHPRAMFVIYHNPLLDSLIVESRLFGKISQAHQYSVYGTTR
jgi:SAM-dependent methyltransferase